MASGEGDDGTVDTAGPRERLEVGEQLLAQPGVTKGYGSDAELAHEDGPEIGAVGPPGAEIDHGRYVLASPIEVTGAGEETGCHRVGMDRSPCPMSHRLG